MIDREKVIKALGICAVGTNSCEKCPLKDKCHGTSNAAMAAAIELLKEQEPIVGWISVKDRLPGLRTCVLCYAEPREFFNEDGKLVPEIAVCFRYTPSE